MKVTLRNRLDVLMKDSGVKSFGEMAERLTRNQGAAITRTAINRKFRDADPTLSMSLVEAICNELQCLPSDLFETEVVDASPEFVEALRTRVQPFRYGVLRIAGPTPSASSSPRTPHGKAAAPGRIGTASDNAITDSRDTGDDDLTGPSVTHLHISKLKPKQ
ncbi:MAG: XRE family transcriptional regulator [Rhodanobacteraceae bacterium]|nr:MAG: XRE family transcriptional regulator [Rhodanobacteraceae bacterium]